MPASFPNLFRALLLLLLLGPAAASGREERARSHCSVENYSLQLGQYMITDLMQDERGLLWVSSWNGLHRFDGTAFRNYKTYPGEDCVLTSNRIDELVPTRDGAIWCITYDRNLYLFDPRTERFREIFAGRRAPDGTDFAVRKIRSFADGCSYAVAGGRLFRIDERRLGREEAEAIREIELDPRRYGDRIVDLVEGGGDKGWIVAERGLTDLDREIVLLPPVRITAALAADGVIYLLTDDGRLAVCRPENGTLTYEHLPIDGATAHTLRSIGADSLAVGTDRGCVIYAARQRRFTVLDLRFDDGRDRSVWAFYKDREANLWIFGDEREVIRYDTRSAELQRFRFSEGEQRAGRMPCCTQDRYGTVWIIPVGGPLCRWDPVQKRLLPECPDPERPQARIAPAVLDRLVDRQGNLWCIDSFGLMRISFHPDNIRYTPLDRGFETRALMSDLQGRLWVATKRGLVRIYDAGRTLRGYLAPDGRLSRTPVRFPGNVYCFQQSERDEIWMGTRSRGLVRLQAAGPESWRVTRFTHDPGDPFSISSDDIYAIFRDSRRRLWIGTFGGGIDLVEELGDGSVRFRHHANAFRRYPIGSCAKVRTIGEIGDALLVGTTGGLLTFASDFDDPREVRFHLNGLRPNDSSCLPANDIYQLFTDSRGESYAATYTGGISRILSQRIVGDSIRFRNYSVREGLSSDLTHSLIEDAEGMLWIVSENAIDRFDPASGRFSAVGDRTHYYGEAIPTSHGDRLVIATKEGVAEIEPRRIRPESYVPPIVFTALRIQRTGERREIDHLDRLQLRPSERDVTFHFAALDYADPEAIQYSYRLEGLEKQWTEASKQHTALYTNLPPGRYTMQVRSTDSNGAWAENLRELPVEVVPMLWETTAAKVCYVLLVAGVLFAVIQIRQRIYRLRHRLNLEQQLTDIKLRFFTDISHELRTPLTLINGPLTEVLEDTSLSGNNRRNLTLVHSNTQRVLRLINQLLDFRKIENGKMKLLIEHTELRELLRRVMEDFRLMAVEKQIYYRLECPDERIEGWVDRDKVEKICFNLISNAFKYTPSGRAITVAARRAGARIEIAVIDEGCGIEPEAQQRLFCRFENTLRRPNLPSSGIGLSLVKELLELMGGTIRVESRVGAGSRFSITLPLEREAYAPLPNVEFLLEDSAAAADRGVLPEEPAAERSGRRPRILVVEDNDELRTFLKETLLKEYRIVEARDGCEGLEQARCTQPDLIVSDVMMPRMDGLEMVRRIKEDRELSHLPIILLSAKSTLDDRIKGLDEGISDYITKPFSTSYLKARIRQLLELYRQLQQRYLTRITAYGDTHAPVLTLDTAEPQQPRIGSSDEAFVGQVTGVIERNLDNADLNVREVAAELHMSHSAFYAKLKQLVGLPPVEFIREVRLGRACKLLAEGRYDVTTVSYMTGFSDPRYFSKCFKKRYGILPSQYDRARTEEGAEAAPETAVCAGTAAESTTEVGPKVGPERAAGLHE